MQVMIATDGHVDPSKASQIAARLAGDRGKVTVLTVVEVPRKLLADIRAAASPDDPDLLTRINVEYSHDRAEAPTEGTPGWIGDDAVIERYLRTKSEDATGELVAELERAGTPADVVTREAEDAARAILAAVDEFGIEVLCIGTHGLGRFEGLLGSISTKIARRAPCSVLLVR